MKDSVRMEDDEGVFKVAIGSGTVDTIDPKSARSGFPMNLARNSAIGIGCREASGTRTESHGERTADGPNKGAERSRMRIAAAGTSRHWF